AVRATSRTVRAAPYEPPRPHSPEGHAPWGRGRRTAPGPSPGAVRTRSRHPRAGVLRQGEPVRPGDVAADEARLPERPVGGDPLRHQRVESLLHLASHQLVHHPPGDLAVRAGPLRRVDVDTA